MDRFFYKLDCFLKSQISRRAFLKILLGGFAAFISNNIFLKKAFARSETAAARKSRNSLGDHDLVVSHGKDPYANTVKAVEKMGGMERFVRQGDVVVVKPNMAWDRTPAQAANTDPGVVAALVDMAYKAGAKRVNVFDITCNEERRCYASSGIAEAAKARGAYVYFPDHWNVAKAHFAYMSPMEGWPLLRDAVDCDVFINAPVLKHHGLTGLTLSMKNLMGICSGTRGLIHVNIGDKLADLTDFIKPDLTVIDATRVLVRHGPSGGDLADVEVMDKVIVATDPFLADSYASELAGRDPMSIPYIKAAAQKGRGGLKVSGADIVTMEAG